MSEAAAIAAVPAAASGQRPLRDVDLYAEGNSFAESDGRALERLFGKDGIGFRDLLDIVNPLQHLPVVGTLYRALTGDALAPGSRILGGTLFGGIGGFVTALVNAVVENETGSDIGDKALALLEGGDPPQQRFADAAAAGTDAPAAAAPPHAPPDPEPREPKHKAFPIFAGPPQRSPTAAQAARPAHLAQRDTPNPTEALIRARAAVPATHRSAIAGLPRAAPAAEPAHARTTAPDATVALAGATPAEKAPAPEPARPSAAGADAAAPDIAFMMRDALDKYEALMKSRGEPSISGDF
jgi:hypothetical protein